MSWSSPLPGQPARLRWALTASTNWSGQPKGASIPTLSANEIASSSSLSPSPERSSETTGTSPVHCIRQLLVLGGCAARSIPRVLTPRSYEQSSVDLGTVRVWAQHAGDPARHLALDGNASEHGQRGELLLGSARPCGDRRAPAGGRDRGLRRGATQTVPAVQPPSPSPRRALRRAVRVCDRVLEAGAARVRGRARGGGVRLRRRGRSGHTGDGGGRDLPG